MKKTTHFIMIVCILFALHTNAQTPDAGNILYVNVNVSGGTGTGNSWANAIPQLANALKYARTQHDANSTVYDTNPLKIYVAKGTYKPLYNAADGSYTTDGMRDNAFVMVKNVQLYGGFDPTNGIDDLTDTRNYTNTILSGDIGTAGTATDNTYHVVIASADVGTALLDGFTVTGGYSASSDNTTISVNSNPLARYSGGGMSNYSSSPAVDNCTFAGNTAPYGGGMLNYSSSSPSIANCSFTANTAGNGGGMFNISSSPTITHCSFTTNTAGDAGGGMYNYSFSSSVITNCSFTTNAAGDAGGGMFNYSSSSIITNTTIARNSGSSGFFDNSSSIVILQNSIVWDVVEGNYAASYSLMKGASDTTDGNIDAGSLAATDIFTDYDNGDYAPKATSPAVDAGNNALYVSAGGSLSADTDLAGNLRVYNSVIDMGAYEYPGILSVPSAPGNKSRMVYPNPVKGMLNFSEEVYDVRIADLSGRVVKQAATSGKSVNVAGLAKGIYVVTAVAKSGEVVTKKIEKE
ncbi:MAG: right-handed parallel beta-helix repeat-containing protein [Edaphocola sp.]